MDVATENEMNYIDEMRAQCVEIQNQMTQLAADVESRLNRIRPRRGNVEARGHRMRNLRRINQINNQIREVELRMARRMALEIIRRADILEASLTLIAILGRTENSQESRAVFLRGMEEYRQDLENIELMILDVQELLTNE